MKRRDFLRGLGAATVAALSGRLPAAAAQRPNIVLIETKRSDGTGVETCRRIARVHPDTTIIVLTSYEDEKERQAAYKAGAARYILKDIDSTQLLRTILRSRSSLPKNRSSS